MSNEATRARLIGLQAVIRDEYKELERWLVYGNGQPPSVKVRQSLGDLMDLLNSASLTISTTLNHINKDLEV
jgi:hypothetical protein